MTSTTSTPTPSPKIESIHYSAATIRRAERAVRCSPFQLALFTAMRWQSVGLKAVAGEAGVQNGYTITAVAELVAETTLLWLIQVGLLRREVDGQGLTDSFRLTPLGQQLVDRWQQSNGFPPATAIDRLWNFVSRWFRLPSWLF